MADQPFVLPPRGVDYGYNPGDLGGPAARPLPTPPAPPSAVEPVPSPFMIGGGRSPATSTRPFQLPVQPPQPFMSPRGFGGSSSFRPFTRRGPGDPIQQPFFGRGGGDSPLRRLLQAYIAAQGR